MGKKREAITRSMSARPVRISACRAASSAPARRPRSRMMQPSSPAITAARRKTSAKRSSKRFSAARSRAQPTSSIKSAAWSSTRTARSQTCASLRRWVGRFFSWGIRFAHAFLWKIGQKTTANTIMMGMVHQPIRGLAKYGGMSRRQMEAMLLMFNGHLFKGIGQFFSKGKN